MAVREKELKVVANARMTLDGRMEVAVNVMGNQESSGADIDR